MDSVRYSKAMSGRADWDVDRDRYPYCVVWSPIPVLTWLLPFIGHIGICTSEGITHDFAGPYFVSRGNMLFGRPTTAWQLSTGKVAASSAEDELIDTVWDRAVREGTCAYEQQMYSFCTNNCHSFVARCLNLLQYEGRSNWNMVIVCLMMFLHGRAVSWQRGMLHWLPVLFTWTVMYFVVFAASDNPTTDDTGG